jgi:hypothetical protein
VKKAYDTNDAKGLTEAQKAVAGLGIDGLDKQYAEIKGGLDQKKKVGLEKVKGDAKATAQLTDAY